MPNYKVKVRIVHDKNDGPSLLVIKAKGDRKILQDIENYALHYEKYLENMKEIYALKKELDELRHSKALK